jgi:hypothetical protein
MVPVEDLNCSSSPASMLPIALSEVLGMSLSEVMKLYFDGSEESVCVHHVEEALDCHMMVVEGEEWLAHEASRLTLDLERNHEGGDDSF